LIDYLSRQIDSIYLTKAEINKDAMLFLCCAFEKKTIVAEIMSAV